MRVVDLFSGCGGLSKGFELAEFELMLAVERWAAARDVYARNFDHPVKDVDLNRVGDAVSLIEKERPNIIVGGPPCQEFSIAGDRVEGDKAKLTIKFAQIIRDVRPQWFVVENVIGLSQSATWQKARKILSGAGYGITEQVLNAAYFGTPQNRKRFFAIGRLDEEDGFLTDQLELGKADDPLSIRDFLGDEFGIDFYYRHPRNWGRRGVFSIDEPSPTIRSTNRPVPPGYTVHPRDAGPLEDARALTTVERARIQTFERNFELAGTITDQNMMIANAVPVQLAQHVAAAIRRYEEERIMISDPEFRNWLTAAHEYTPRTAGNVISRLKRATKILDSKNLPPNPLDALDKLDQQKEFRKLGVSIRSQIRKAIRLHAEFHGQ
ncbi:DNA (cytosine-5-)-methyltransferase [Massilia sp. MB5]|uniref:DNA cytosine methyltransferase n=1 Tax=Massilia sp. MB5 TaxID=2919578 RepID=UPI001F0F73A2|nr:DNA (cytosine-5-)-methyltransferase [Massilia sp. MB5]UMR31987.1 DNA (cytosine-5-)-methyltransferase [Massilia sp. MB5]